MDLVDVQVVYNATSRLDETVEENRASPICYGHPTPLASTNSVQRSSAVSSTVLTCTFGGTSFSSSRIPRFPRPHDEHAPDQPPVRDLVEHAESTAPAAPMVAIPQV